ncbi:MAG TPA: helix-turn-helix domain-containing protein [Bacillota bacterium]
MWQAVLIDDEEYVRAELAALFPWARYQFTLIGEAENAREAMALIAKNQPDLVITDIRMPEMDGLELIAWLGQYYPRLVTAVVSAYNDFHYVREALRLGAVDYLMKAEATLETAGSFLQRLSRILDSRRSVQHQYEELSLKMNRYHQLAVESFWRDLITGSCDETEIVQRGQQLGIVLESVWFGLILLQPTVAAGDNPTTFCESLKAKIRAVWDWDWNWNLIDFNQGEYLILAHQTGEQPGPDALGKLGEIACQLVQDTAVKMTVGVSVELCSFRELAGNFREVREILSRSARSPLVNGLTPAAVTVRKALVYMQLNFSRDLSLKEVSDHVGVSKSYLSRIFPEYAGEHFSSYLQRLRLERAKELLRYTNDRIYEIASQVGFWNSRYFSKVFQEAVGLTPADYRRLEQV